MTIHPLIRNIAIGVASASVVAAAIGAAWWTGARPNDSLAARLPAEAVLAYASLPSNGDAVLRTMMELAPRLPAFPEGMDEQQAMEAAAVRMADGTEGWLLRAMDAHGDMTVWGSDPALKRLLEEPSSVLASDRTFNMLQWTDGSAWGYLNFSFSKLSPQDSPAAPLFTLWAPVAFRLDGGLSIRQTTNRAPRLQQWSGTPLVTVPDADVTLLLPPWRAIGELEPLLNDDARTVAETLATSFLHDIAGGMSLRYDASTLLHGPSLFQAGKDGAFALEGHGINAAGTDRVLRAIHAKFAATRGGATVRDVSAEGFTLRTMTRGEAAETTERMDGAWTIVETAAGGDVLTSARDGNTFMITNVPGGMANANGPTTVTSSIIRWSETAEARMRPISATLLQGGASLEFTVEEGPGYVQWTRIGVSAL